MNIAPKIQVCTQLASELLRTLPGAVTNGQVRAASRWLTEAAEAAEAEIQAVTEVQAVTACWPGAPDWTEVANPAGVRGQRPGP